MQTSSKQRVGSGTTAERERDIRTPLPTRSVGARQPARNSGRTRVRGSIRWKLLSTMIGLIVGLVVTLTAIELVLQKKYLELELDRRVQLIRENLLERSRTLASVVQPQVENDLASLNFSRISEVLTKAIEDSELLTYAILMNEEGVAFSSPQQSEQAQHLLHGEGDRFALAQTQSVTREYPDLDIVEFILPIHFGAKKWGVLRLGFSLAEVNSETARSRADIAAQIRNMILMTGVIAAFFIVIGSGIVLLIATTLSRPLIRLTASVRELARGNFDAVARLLESERGPGRFKADGEIGLLARSFVDMASELRHSHQQLEEYNRTLEEKVRSRTQELEQAYEKLKELDQLKTNFLSTVSHELRTPLTSVLGFARIIQKKFEATLLPTLAAADDKKVERAVRQVMENTRIIVEEGERLTTLINDVLDLAKMEAGRTDWNMQPLRVTDVIERAMSATAALFAVKPVALRKEFDPGLPEVLGDRDRLIQVVINLISNAVKFTDEGSVTCKAEQRGDAIVVSVTDTGCGIKPEDQLLVFEKFKQVGDTLTDKPKGTGLGLPICKEIVEHHGGQVWVESQLGQGSTFLFSLPITAAAAPAAAPAETPFVRETTFGDIEAGLRRRIERRAAGASEAPAHVVIVDDDTNIRQLLRLQLASEGCRVSEAESGIQGLRLIAEDPPDLVILDLRMPYVDGFAVAARLRSDPETLDLPIILHTVADEQKRSEAAGIDAFVTKLVEGGVLLGEVRMLLTPPVPRDARRVLLMDRDGARRRRLEELLCRAGYRVETSDDGAAAIALAETMRPHLLIAEKELAEQSRIVQHLRTEKGMVSLYVALTKESAVP